MNNTTKQLTQMYQKIYREDYFIPTHRGRKHFYGASAARDNIYLSFIKQNLSRDLTILDASCGRGHLMRSLIEEGYNKIEGTEIEPSLLKTDLQGLHVKIMDYDALRTFREEHFDIVISNDVLEHLLDENAVERAIQDLCYISKKWVLISVGAGSALNFPKKYKDLPVRDLHTVNRSCEWWKNLISKYVDLKMVCKKKISWWGFGVKRCS